MNKILVIAATLLLFIVSPAAFAKNCKKGQPCGNSCISWSKTCRIGTGSGKPSEISTSNYRSNVSSNTSPMTSHNQSQIAKKYGLYEVTTTRLNVRSKPNPNSEILGHLTKGMRIKVYSFSGDWALVPYLEGLQWANANYLEFVGTD